MCKCGMAFDLEHGSAVHYLGSSPPLRAFTGSCVLMVGLHSVRRIRSSREVVICYKVRETLIWTPQLSARF